MAAADVPGDADRARRYVAAGHPPPPAAL